MQSLITYILNIVALISLRELTSRHALRVYGGLLLLVGVVIGHVALMLLGVVCLYFGLREPAEKDPDPPKSSDVLEAVVLVLISTICGCSCGCETADSPRNYRALPAPAAEAPVINPDVSIRQSNWLGPNREGSCAHASLVNELRWLNKWDLAEKWKKTYKGDGEWSSRIRERCDEQNIPFAYTLKANLALLDYAHSTRRGAILWWKPGHCCTFCGWVEMNGRTYAVILDNNSVGRYELTERSQFHSLWAGYGGFALCVLFDPPSPPLYRSYERVEHSFF
jgi:hypothetical protein